MGKLRLIGISPNELFGTLRKSPHGQKRTSAAEEGAGQGGAANQERTSGAKALLQMKLLRHG